MIIICLEGCHGSGKTELCKQFEQEGFWVLDEAFLDMPEYALHPQSLLMETSWVVAWFMRLLKHAAEIKGKEGPEPIFIADRSPFSAVFYASCGGLLEPVIREQMAECMRSADIEMFTVYLQVEKETLWTRIQERLLREPGRAKYHEGERSWMEKTLQFYETFTWDMTVDNSLVTIPQLKYDVVDMLSKRSLRFKASVNHLMSSSSSSMMTSPPRVTRSGSVRVGDELSPTRGLTDERVQQELASLAVASNTTPTTALQTTMVETV